MTRIILIGAIVLVLHGAGIPASGADEPAPLAAQVEFFEKRIRPVLSEHCFGCHGAKKQEGGLRLDSRATLLKGGDNGPVVMPGLPNESDLVAAIRHDGATKMPPKGPLPPAAVAAIEEWIRQGAIWPEPEGGDLQKSATGREHWAFRPVQSPPIPVVRQRGWVQTDVDRFVLARLEERGLSPAPAAERPTLIRRATLDLLGLPPTPEEVADFEADPEPTPRAFARVVDRLLESPHYGERWGRYWLDVARYADNKGYVFFEEQSYPWAHAYRDWVIGALNDDLPIDQFILQQLAADQLPSPQLPALGFLTIGGHFMNNVHDIFDDRIDAVTRGLLGLTVTCARCHDHKYDPIPQADYYGLYGVFRSTSEPLVPPRFQPVPDTELFEYYELGLAERQTALEKFLDGKHTELVTGARTRVAEYLLAAHAARDQPTTEEFMLLIPKGDLHPSVVQRYWLHLQRTRRQHDPVWGVWHALAAIPEADFDSRAPAVCTQLAAQTDPDRPLNPLVVEAVCQSPPSSLKDVAQRYSDLLLRIDRQMTEKSHRPTDPAGATEQLHQFFHAPDAPANVPRVAGWGVLTLLPDREAQAEYQKLLKVLEQWMIHGPHAPVRAMVLVDEPVPYESRVFLRGNPNRPGDLAPRKFLSVLDPGSAPFTQGSGRLELAQAIVDPRNPLTARVFVNRVWRHHFGAGLVKTPSDFGVRSEPPSHPELLDLLTGGFIADRWSLKNLHRRIMLSAVYQQSSVLPGEGTEPGTDGQRLDPENRLLWQFPRRRLDFEALRDSLLAVAGTLDRALGGPPASLLAGSNRRSVYGFIDRLALPGLLRTFDFPSPDATSPQRDETTVAPQALFLMNGPLAQACASQLLLRPEIAGETQFVRRVERLYRLLFARSATPEEWRLAAEFIGQPTDGTAESLRALTVTPDSAPAWKRYAQALLLTNEFAFVD